MVGDLKNGRTVKSLVKLLNRFEGNSFCFVSPEDLKFNEKLPMNSYETTDVNEVLNEISIDNGYGIDDIAKDKFISTQLFTKIFTDSNIKKFKYDFEVQKQIVYLFGVSSDQKEIDMVIEHAKNIKGVLDIINYIQVR